jgi:hypothetical protein
MQVKRRLAYYSSFSSIINIITKIIVQTMNEQRTQAYLNLINQLLSCNDGDESRILQEN